MSRRLLNNLRTSAQPTHFARKLKQHQYKVIPPPPVPQHIIKPQYALNPSNPQFAEYQGQPRILTAQEIQKIKVSARIAADTLQATQNFLALKAQQNIQSQTDGTLTAEDIDTFVYNFIISKNAYPTPIGFIGFPKSVCISINQCIVHGIPSLRPIYLGDKINIDVTAYYDGFHGDTNLTVIFGGEDKAPTKQVRNIIKITQQALYKAIGVCKPGVRFSQIGRTIQKFAQENGVDVCEHFTGHGVGRLLHMPPMVYHVEIPNEPLKMQPGNVFTIQPIITQYPTENNIQLWQDGLTVISQNNPNAQFQHMVLITKNGCEVLTQREGENIPNFNQNIENLKVYQ